MISKTTSPDRQLKLFKKSRVGSFASAVRRAVMFTIDNTRFSEAVGKIQNCMKTWAEKKDGDKLRYRGLGCGDRRHCPTCGGYTQDVLAREAYESMSKAQVYFDIVGHNLECAGFHVIMTRPKFISEREHLLLSDGNQKEYAEKSGEFFHIGMECLKKEFGNAGIVIALHPFGETNPGEPYDHLDCYVTPFVKEGDKFIPSHYWRDVERFKISWRDRLNSHYGLDLARADARINYIETDRQLRHCLNYLFRHPLQDIWKGLRGRHGDCSEYVHGHGKRKLVPVEKFNQAYEFMSLLPAHFKRVRWSGILADGVRSKTMSSLWLEPENIEDEKEPELETVRYLTLVNYLDAGIRLKANLTGEIVDVPFGQIDCRPQGVSIGRRKRWHEPGWKPATPLELANMRELILSRGRPAGAGVPAGVCT